MASYVSETLGQPEYYDLQLIGLVGDVWDDSFHNCLLYCSPPLGGQEGGVPQIYVKFFVFGRNVVYLIEFPSRVAPLWSGSLAEYRPREGSL